MTLQFIHEKETSLCMYQETCLPIELCRIISQYAYELKIQVLCSDRSIMTIDVLNHTHTRELSNNFATLHCSDGGRISSPLVERVLPRKINYRDYANAIATVHSITGSIDIPSSGSKNPIHLDESKFSEAREFCREFIYVGYMSSNIIMLYGYETFYFYYIDTDTWDMMNTEDYNIMYFDTRNSRIICEKENDMLYKMYLKNDKIEFEKYKSPCYNFQGGSFQNQHGHTLVFIANYDRLSAFNLDTDKIEEFGTHQTRIEISHIISS